MANKAKLRKGETVNIEMDWSRIAKKTGLTVSSATWAADNSNVSLGTPTLSLNVSVVPTTNANSDSGCSTLSNTATMSDGQVFVRKVMLELVDESCSPSAGFERYR